MDTGRDDDRRLESDEGSEAGDINADAAAAAAVDTAADPLALPCKGPLPGFMAKNIDKTCGVSGGLHTDMPVKLLKCDVCGVYWIPSSAVPGDLQKVQCDLICRSCTQNPICSMKGCLVCCVTVVRFV